MVLISQSCLSIKWISVLKHLEQRFSHRDWYINITQRDQKVHWNSVYRIVLNANTLKKNSVEDSCFMEGMPVSRIQRFDVCAEVGFRAGLMSTVNACALSAAKLTSPALWQPWLEAISAEDFHICQRLDNGWRSPQRLLWRQIRRRKSSVGAKIVHRCCLHMTCRRTGVNTTWFLLVKL